MTKIAISPNVSGTGTFTLTAPDSNTDRTLTLPDAGGEIITTSGLADAIPEFAPNAVIVESDSNANGSFIKYSDGTMIVTKRVSFTGRNITMTFGNVFGSGQLNIGAMAAAFVSIPAITAFITNQSGPSMWLGTQGANNSNESNFSVFEAYRGTSATGTNFTVNATAIGRWK